MTTSAPLAARLPPKGATPDDLLDAFLGWVESLGLTLYPAQEEALLEVFSGANVVLSTPTGSGKTLVATAMHFKALAEGKRSFYTSPIKALVSEKFFALCRDFGAENVGMVTGDASVNGRAPIICCTAEILGNLALREGSLAEVDYAILDEFHYYADRDRGVAWQVPLLVLGRTRFLLMSATLGDPTFFVEELERRTGTRTALVSSTDRPVPLDYEYRETPLHETLASLVASGRAPVYVVSFTQRACAEIAQDLLSVDFLEKDEKRAIQAAIGHFRFDSPYGKEVGKLLRHGIAVHHAGLLPKYRLLTEKLAQQGHLRVICGTDTLGVGVNIPIRTVLFTKLCKYDGEKTTVLRVRDFQQIAGRAGRKGFDERGSVVAQAPEHVIENLRIEAKILGDPSKKKKLVKKKPPDFGYVHWDRSTFERLIQSKPELLVSRFQVTHAMILDVLGRPSGGCRALVRLVRDCHEPPGNKRTIAERGRLLYRSLIDGQIIVPDEHGVPRVHVDLQIDFALNQPLSLWLLEVIELLEEESPTYELDVLTLVESILEDPDVVLRKQLDKLKGETVARLKQEGVEYDDRMKALEELEYPKPLRELVYDTYDEFRKKHPWATENIRPKSVAREMYETFQSFSEYVKTYELQRSEGLLLRYLTDVYKVVVQTVPEQRKTEVLDDIVAYFGAMVRQVDSSLLDEWERLRDPVAALIPVTIDEQLERKYDVTRDVRGFVILVRNAFFHLLRALSARDFAEARELIEPADPLGEPWSDERLGALSTSFAEDHTGIRLDASARSPSHTRIERTPERWDVVQVVPDLDGHDDWAIEATIDLAASREAGKPVIVVSRIGH